MSASRVLGLSPRMDWWKSLKLVRSIYMGKGGKLDMHLSTTLCLPVSKSIRKIEMYPGALMYVQTVTLPLRRVSSNRLHLWSVIHHTSDYSSRYSFALALQGVQIWMDWINVWKFSTQPIEGLVGAITSLCFSYLFRSVPRKEIRDWNGIVPLCPFHTGVMMEITQSLPASMGSHRPGPCDSLELHHRLVAKKLY